MKDDNRTRQRIEEIKATLRNSYPDEIYDLVCSWNGNEAYWFYTALKERGVENIFAMAQELVSLKKKISENE